MDRKKAFKGCILRIAVKITILVILMAGVAVAATEIDSCTTISSPGEYVLNTSIINSGISKCINITSSNVVFDGGNNIIDGVDASNSYGVYVYNSMVGLTNVTIINVIVTDWSYGIYYQTSQNGKIINNTVSSNYDGIDIYDTTNNMLANNTAKNNQRGIVLRFSDNNILLNNTANFSTEVDISLWRSSGNTLMGNTINKQSKKQGLLISGNTLQHFRNNIGISNIINGLPVLYIDGIFSSCPDNALVSYGSNYSQITFIGCNNVTLQNTHTIDTIVLAFTSNSTVKYSGSNDSYYGILLSSSNSYNSITNNIVDGNYFGIYLDSSNYNTIENNIASINYIGISISYSNHNILTNNSANGNSQNGFFFDNSNNNTFMNNNVSSNNIGTRLDYSDNNTITNNIANDNWNWGILFGLSRWNVVMNNNISGNDIGIGLMSSNSDIISARNNTIYNNQFNNTINFAFYGTIYSNNWNITNISGTNIIGGSYLGGNFWAYPNGTGFSQTCTDTDKDGICDSPYVLDVNNTDYLPLAQITYPVHNINKGTDYFTIQSAINDANTGDEIRVDRGTYYENVNVNKQLNLRGVDTGGGKPVVDAGGSGNSIILSVDGITLRGFSITNSSLSGWSGAKIISKNNTIVDNDIFNNSIGIDLDYLSSNNSIRGNNISNNRDTGIMAYKSNNNNITENNIINNGNNGNGCGLYANWFNNNNLSNNNISNNQYCGIELTDQSDDNIFTNNVINSTFWGIILVSSDHNNLSRNIVSNNYGPLIIDSANYNEITNNIASGNRENFRISNTYNNKIYNNIFNSSYLNNNIFWNTTNNWNATKQVGTNIISGLYIGGNFWANPSGTGFSQTCTDADRDGICDSPYVIDANNTDYLPLAAPDTVAPVITIASPQSITYSTTNIPLNVSANEPISTWLYSLNGAPNVTFTPNTTITASQGANNLIVYSRDMAGNWNSSSVSFSVDIVAPVITIASPQSITYTTTSIALNVSANKPISTWLYSLNGAPNVTFTPNTTITATEGSNNLIVYANDIAGNWNTSRVDFSVDTTPPASVTNLKNITYASTYINWTWTDPTYPDFAKVMVYLDGVYKNDVLKGVQYFNATVTPGTYTIGTRTVDVAGNINATMKTYTATTILPAIRYINGTVMDSITKDALSGVTVSTTGVSTTSNTSGFYSLKIANGTYPITATYDIRYYTNNSVTVSTALSAVMLQDIELVKKPTGNITGSVTRI